MGITGTTAKISIHAPREGGDYIKQNRLGVPAVFQSTPPARGATESSAQVQQYANISIHAPREGGDPPEDRGT